MRRSVLSLFILLASLCTARAIQLGDTRQEVVAHYGLPSAGNLESDESRGSYWWNGWRLDVEIERGTVQRMIFARDPGPVSEAEERQLLNENGGLVAWQRVNQRWLRGYDGAEAYPIGEDRRAMCLVTRAWLEARSPPPTIPGRAPILPIIGPVAVAGVVSAKAATPVANGDPLRAFKALLGGIAVFVSCVVAFLGFVYTLVVLLFRKMASRPAVARPVNVPEPTPTLHRRTSLTRDVLAALEPGSAPENREAPSPPKALSVPPSTTSRSTRGSGSWLSKSPVPVPRTVADLSWQEFEMLIGEIYRRQGYAVEMCAGEGADGGVDVWLRNEGETVLVQCKHWQVYKVGASPVRELFGVLMGEGATRAILVTTGRFTQDARAFAAGKPMELIDGEQLSTVLAEAKYSGEGDLLDLESWSGAFLAGATITTPTCPFCRTEMVQCRGRLNAKAFWGCSKFPKCSGKRNVRPELMKEAAASPLARV